jgi:hypothetical protein
MKVEKRNSSTPSQPLHQMEVSEYLQAKTVKKIVTIEQKAGRAAEPVRKFSVSGIEHRIIQNIATTLHLFQCSDT